jgi:sulfur carrier protein ThiS
MKITISLRGHLIKYFDGEKTKEVEVKEGATCDDALKAVGIDWKETKSFGFVAINNHKVLMDAILKDGDDLKAYPKISGG